MTVELDGAGVTVSDVVAVARRGERVRLSDGATRVPGPGPDRWLSPELSAAEQMLEDESLVAPVEAVTGPLA